MIKVTKIKIFSSSANQMLNNHTFGFFLDSAFDKIEEWRTIVFHFDRKIYNNNTNTNNVNNTSKFKQQIDFYVNCNHVESRKLPSKFRIQQNMAPTPVSTITSYNSTVDDSVELRLSQREIDGLIFSQYKV